MAKTYKKRGSLHSKMGRPSHGAMSSFSGSLIQRIEQMRKQHRGWGPTTILAELKYEGQWEPRGTPKQEHYWSIASTAKME
jgi:hypothetical protein